MLRTFIWMVKGWSGWMVDSVFLGNTNLDEGATSKLMMRPIGVGLHDPSTDLFTIRKGSVLSQAKVDEIVLRGEGADLARIGVGALTVLRQTRGNDSRVER
jgi:hypothetical protein